MGRTGRHLRQTPERRAVGSLSLEPSAPVTPICLASRGPQAFGRHRALPPHHHLQPHRRPSRRRVQGRGEGRGAGELNDRAKALVDILRLRGLPLSDSDAQRIPPCLDSAELDAWCSNRLLVAQASALFVTMSQLGRLSFRALPSGIEAGAPRGDNQLTR